MAFPWAPAPSGSWCAIHPGMPAAASCPRCGNFACDECTRHGEAEFCPGCVQRLGAERRFPLHRDNWSINAVLEYGWTAFRREWLMLSLAALIDFGGTMALGLAGTLLQTAVGSYSTPAGLATVIVSYLVQYAIGGFLTMGLARICIDVLDGQRADLMRLFSQGGKIPSYMLLILILGLALAAPAALGIGASSYLGQHRGAVPVPAIVGGGVLLLLFLAAGIYALIALVPMPFELAIGGSGPVATIRNCFVMARGQRLPLFAVELLGTLAAGAGVFACCIGVFPAFALGQLFIGGVYLALRRGSGIQPEV